MANPYLKNIHTREIIIGNEILYILYMSKYIQKKKPVHKHDINLKAIY